MSANVPFLGTLAAAHAADERARPVDFFTPAFPDFSGLFSSPNIRKSRCFAEGANDFPGFSGTAVAASGVPKHRLGGSISNADAAQERPAPPMRVPLQ
jgi:hypothetical protein